MICDNVTQIVRKGINENGLAFVEYIFEKAGHMNITEDLYDAGFFYRNYFTGELEPYDDIYIKAFEEYVSVLKKNKINVWLNLMIIILILCIVVLKKFMMPISI